MIKNVLLIIFLLSISSFAQVTISVDAIEFQEIFTSTTDSASFYLINNFDVPVSLEINNQKNVYSLSDTSLLIPANDSTIVWIKYQPNQNVIDDDVILITSLDSTIGAALNIHGIAKFGDSYDATTFNKYDSELKTALTTLVSNHTSLGYNLARDKMFMEIDNQKINGQGEPQNTLECVYTGRKAIGYTSRTDAQNNYNFNTEHTWPQSNFSENEPMRSDLYHLFPTDNPANGVRSNYPFGKVVSSITWDSAGSKLGRNSLNEIVFEPRDIHKGDVSRSMFYFITRYPVNYGSFFTQTQENVFREWNKLDVVGAIESNRNSAIALLQLKRNPYIDHPEFIDRIYSFATNSVRPTFAELNVLPIILNFDSTLIDDTTSLAIYFANSGSAELSIDSIIISDSRFSINSNLSFIESYSSYKIELEFIPDSVKNYNAVLTVYSDGGTKQVLLTGIGKDDAVSVNDENYLPLTFSLSQNYPNPFNPVTNISWQSPVSGWQTLKVFDILGTEVTTLVNEFRNAGSYEVNFEASHFPSGVYFYRLQSGSFIETKKMMMLK